MPAIQQAFKNCLKGTPTIAQRQELRNYFENWIRAIRDGVGYVRKRPEVDENRVGLIGLSLGGYLAVSVAAEKESRLAAVVECFGGLETEITKDVKNLPPTLVIHDEKDQTVPVKEAYALLGRLVANNVPHEFKVYTGVGHVFMDDKGNFNLLAALNAETRTVAFLEKYLKGAAVASAPPRS
jgi:dienelactone hydrolase